MKTACTDWGQLFLIQDKEQSVLMGNAVLNVVLMNYTFNKIKASKSDGQSRTAESQLQQRTIVFLPNTSLMGLQMSIVTGIFFFRRLTSDCVQGALS